MSLHGSCRRRCGVRHKFFDMVSAERATVVGFHYQFPAIGHVENNGTGYRLVRAAWNPTL